MDNAIKSKAEMKLRLGIDPLKVHEWLMRQGIDVEEADRITGCKTVAVAQEDYPWSNGEDWPWSSRS